MDTFPKSAAMIALEPELLPPQNLPKIEITNAATASAQHSIKGDEYPQMDSAANADDAASSLALLPKNTIVRISGNNRTRPALIGLEAIVRRSMGLGGWHWLMLSSGVEVKLQRNALTVLQYPAVVEPSSSVSEGDQMMKQHAMKAERAHYLAGGECPPPAATTPPPRAAYKRPRLAAPSAPRPATMLEASVAPAEGGRRSGLRPAAIPVRVNLAKLDTPALRRYVSAFSLQPDGGAGGREEILGAANAHFDTMEVTEEDVVRRFLEAARRHSMGTAAAPSRPKSPLDRVMVH